MLRRREVCRRIKVSLDVLYHLFVFYAWAGAVLACPGVGGSSCSSCPGSDSGSGEVPLSKDDHTDHTQNGKNFTSGMHSPIKGKAIRLPSFKNCFPFVILSSWPVLIQSHTPTVTKAIKFQIGERMSPMRKKSKKIVIEPCNKLLDEFFANTIEKQEGLDKRTIQILKELYQKKQFTANNIAGALKNVRLNLHE